MRVSLALPLGYSFGLLPTFSDGICFAVFTSSWLFSPSVLFCSVSLTVLFLGITLGSFVAYMHLCEEYGTTHIHGICDVVKETSFVVVLGGGFVLGGGGWRENPTLGFWI